MVLHLSCDRLVLYWLVEGRCLVFGRGRDRIGGFREWRFDEWTGEEVGYEVGVSWSANFWELGALDGGEKVHGFGR